jgi:hypothetical protein
MAASRASFPAPTDAHIFDMNPSAYAVVRTARTETEAERVVEALLSAFHPADLDPSAHYSFSEEEDPFRIEVPAGEATAAREFLKSYSDPENEA